MFLLSSDFCLETFDPEGELFCPVMFDFSSRQPYRRCNAWAKQEGMHDKCNILMCWTCAVQLFVCFFLLFFVCFHLTNWLKESLCMYSCVYCIWTQFNFSVTQILIGLKIECAILVEVHTFRKVKLWIYFKGLLNSQYILSRASEAGSPTNRPCSDKTRARDPLVRPQVGKTYRGAVSDWIHMKPLKISKLDDHLDKNLKKERTAHLSRLFY